MIIIAEAENKKAQMMLYFAIDPDNREKPFVFGGYSTGSTPFQWASASAFNLESIDSIDGSLFHDWRAALKDMGCANRVIPVLEKALQTGDQEGAIEAIRNYRST